MMVRSARWLVLLLAPLGCEGSLTGPGNGGSGPFGVSGDPASNPGKIAGAPAAASPPGAEFDIDSECKKLGSAKSPGKAPLRRLTRVEYDNTVAELLNDSSQAGGGLPPEARALGFYNNADAQSVTSLLVEGYKTAAEGIAGRATANVSQLLGCAETEATCVDGFIQRVGSRAYRRPLLPDEAQRLRALYDWGALNSSAKDGVQMVLELLLQSPDFLYRPELGAEEVAPGVRRVSSYEMATRLSSRLPALPRPMRSPAPPDPMALACDLTRVGSVMWNCAVGRIVHNWVDPSITRGHHDISHDGDSASASVEWLTKINVWYAQQFAYFLGKLDAIPEGDGTLLDNSVVLWCNELAKGNDHSRDNTHYVVAGGAQYFKMGRLIQFPYGDKVRHNNLLLSLVQSMGIEDTTFGKPDWCSGPLSGMVS